MPLTTSLLSAGSPLTVTPALPRSLFVPTALSFYWYSNGRLGILGGRGAGPYPVHMREHVAMAWSIGCLMSFLAETYRRQMFANHKLAADAAARELLQAKVRDSRRAEEGARASHLGAVARDANMR